MKTLDSQSYTAFLGEKVIARGRLSDVALKMRVRQKDSSSVLIFSDLTGKEMDLDLRGSEKEVLARLQIYLAEVPNGEPASGPGRPKLGVVAREVSLLPRHWEWLATQSGGASATLRRLIDEAKKDVSGKNLVKLAQERAYKFMAALAGNLPGYEEALRALYARDKKKFREQSASWPSDVREYAQSLAGPAFFA